jgi:thioesterase domain-containing protein
MISGPSNCHDLGLADAIIAAVAAEANCEPTKIEPFIKFRDLGVNSFMNIAILHAVRARTGEELPMSFLSDYPTITAVRKQFANASKMTIPLSTSLDQVSPEYTSKSRLIQGSHESGLPALFLLAPGSGFAESYKNLPRFASGLPVYALQSPFLRAPEKFTCSFETMATLYLQEIRRIQPHGPYLIGGWSIGGMFAYEAARQILLQGEEVQGIIMLDSPYPQPRPDMPEPTVEILQPTGLFRVINANGKPETDIPLVGKQHVVSTFKAVKRYSPIPMNPDRRPAHVFLMWAKYGVYDFMADVVKESSRVMSTQGNAASAKSPLIETWQSMERSSCGPCGWEELLGRDGVECSVIDGDHESIMIQPDVSVDGLYIKTRSMLTAIKVEITGMMMQKAIEKCMQPHLPNESAKNQEVGASRLNVDLSLFSVH